MNPERWQQINEVFQAALERSPSQRTGFLADVCAGDESLRREVESLIASHEQADSLIDIPAIQVAAPLFADEEDELLVGRSIGHYTILTLLGEGGMGKVYLAQDARLGRKIAFKVLPSYFTKDKNRLRRFQQEARAASALNHPNILTVHEIGEADGTPFITTEFIDGETLRERMTRTRMKASEALDVATQVASALASAHAAGIVHRDIKPENIMLRNDGIAKVLDFGLAKLTEPQAPQIDSNLPTAVQVKTSPGMVMGTANYMSPEQARGLPVDARTDIWSLGVVLYEMIAGCMPFQGATPSDVISLILQKEPLTLLRYAPETPVELERIVTKVLTKDKEERYQTAKDLLIDLRRLKQRLGFEAELERTAPPEISNPLASATAGKQAIIEKTREPAARSTSSAEYIVSEIKSHKRSAVLALFILVIAIASVAYVYYARNHNKAAINSIAVMPFVNTNRDADTEYLSDGITESLINSLSQIPHLRMISRASVFRYKGREIDPQKVGSELGVQAILTGRVVEHGDDLSISVELVDASDNTHIWGDQYNRKLSDILTIQGDISQAISERLRLRLTGEEQQRATKRYTDNPEAYQLYLQGRYYWNKNTEEGIKKGLDYFTQAIKKDPNYALAYAGLADSYLSLRSFYLPPREVMPEAKTAAIKALELDENLAEAHGSLGFVRGWYDWDFAAAEREFKRAVELNPNYAFAHRQYAGYLAAMGRTQEAIAEIKRAQELDPTALNINTAMAFIFFWTRQYDQAILQGRKTLELEPKNGRAHTVIGLAYLRKGEFSQAVAEAQQGAKFDDSPLVLAMLGGVYAESGNRVDATKVLAELKEQSKRRYVCSYEVATIFVGLGERDEAFRWLDKAYDERSDCMIWLKVDPRLDPIRPDSRFADLLRRVGHTP